MTKTKLHRQTIGDEENQVRLFCEVRLFSEVRFFSKIQFFNEVRLFSQGKKNKKIKFDKGKKKRENQVRLFCEVRVFSQVVRLGFIYTCSIFTVLLPIVGVLFDFYSSSTLVRFLGFA
ncbi:hypothetical protein Dimus_022190 [Dionaea muscipula]